MINIRKTYIPTTVLRRVALWLTALLLLPALSGCLDDELLRPNTNGDGGDVVQLTVSFFPNVESNVGSRSAGNSIESINSLQVVLFDVSGRLVKLYQQSDLKDLNMKLTHSEVPDSMSKEDEANKCQWTEGSQARATFRIEGVESGAYKMYCVANFTLTDSQIKVAEGEAYETDEEKFRNIRFTWQTNVGINNQMCGYFTYDDKRLSDKPLDGLGAQEILIDGSNTPLHCWLKRMASKVTIAFDPSGLHKDVNIYIHKVTIKDIPASCAIASSNKPSATKRDSELIADGETIYYGKTGESANDPGTQYENWMQLDNNTGVKGSKHEATSNALFFYENNQGDYQEKSDTNPNPEAYNKTPKAGWVHAYLDRPDSDKGKRPWDYDTKDNVAAGSYIEVEAYYKSENDEKITSGPIYYRFMLGKNTTYNYNAERNHHYKLTLKFNGWANQPEWHIDYVEEKPALYTPLYYYMPYLYHKRVDMPIRFIGPIEKITVDIIDNDWGPYDYEAVKKKPSSDGMPAYSTSDLGNKFNWNRESWDMYNGLSPNGAYKADGVEKNGKYFLGFLSLALEKSPEANIIDDKTFSAGDDAFAALENYYNTYLQTNKETGQFHREFDVSDLIQDDPSGKTEYGSENSDYQNYHYNMLSESDSRTLMLPMFTRAKSMIGASGFSGNNPYEYFYRRATLRITAVFSDAAKTTITRDVRIMQVPRITNPKGIWYPSDGTSRSFNVTLMTRVNSDINSNFTPLISDGSWTAELEVGDVNHFSLSAASGSKEVDGKIQGNNNAMNFKINFDGTASSAIVLVRYNHEKCVHRIFVRQGYGPVKVTSGGATWLSYNLYHGGDGTSKSTAVSTGARLVNNPLSFGAYFKRKALKYGICESNNDRSGYGHLQYMNTSNGYSGKPLKLTSGAADVIWYQIQGACLKDQKTVYGYDTKGNALYIGSNPNKTKDNIVWQDVKVGTTTYYLPTYDDFAELTKNGEFGYGIFYTEGATGVQTDFAKATGYAMQYDSGSASYGMRGIVVYNEQTAKQVFFPLSKSGFGRRMQAFVDYADRHMCGKLQYGDVDRLLTNAAGKYNKYRPIAYNLPNDFGAMYWINKINLTGHREGTGLYPCAAWDMNYFNLDFGPYTANCLYSHCGTNYSGGIGRTGSDALPIRLVSKHTTKTGPNY